MFKVGDIVKWADTKDKQTLSNYFGDGPFTIHNLEDNDDGTQFVSLKKKLILLGLLELIIEMLGKQSRPKNQA